MEHARVLDPSHPYKPLDFGNGLVAGTVAPDGTLLSLNTYHSEHGYVSLSGQPPFPDERRYDPQAVRAYRAALAQPDAPGFGLKAARPWGSITTLLDEDAIPHSQLEGGPLQAQVLTWASLPGGWDSLYAVQEWHFLNRSKQSIAWKGAWSGQLYLGRASMTQLTEGGVIPMPPTALEVAFDRQILTLFNPALRLTVAISGLPPGQPFHQFVPSGLLVNLPWTVNLASGEEAWSRYVLAFGSDPEDARVHALQAATGDLAEEGRAVRRYWRQQWVKMQPPPPIEILVHRALAYVLECCCQPVSDDSVCLLTDHQILPLSWNRDSYYLLQALLIRKDPGCLSIARRHLIWLYEQAQRPQGTWARAYLPNGRAKDWAFQLDQQCYPLLELAEYEQRSGDAQTVERLLPALPAILEAILARRARQAELYATEETPADDPLALPYHFSSQVLLWHTLHRLIPLQRRFPFAQLDLDGLAEGLYRSIWDHLVAEVDGHKVFVYAADLGGAYRLYQDANDLPSVLAPVWGFCSHEDPVWRATMAFAFGPKNQAGYFPGPTGGLGSVHTPGAWPLGDVQELIYARLVGDADRAEAVLQLLASTACWDGALPEARDPMSGEVRSRHWFAWPNCALLVALSLPAEESA